MIETYIRRAQVIDTGNNQVIQTFPIKRLSTIKVSIDITAIAGAPSITFRLMNVDTNEFLEGDAVNQTGDFRTAVRDNAGAAITTAALAAVALTELYSGWPANAREVVALVADNTAAAGNTATVTTVVTVTDGA